MIIQPEDALDAGEQRVGGKAKGLARVARLDHLRVPPWFVVAAECGVGHLGRSGELEGVIAGLSVLSDDLTGLDEASSSFQQAIIDHALSDALRSDVASALERLEGPFAVRSSMVGEDAASASYAGQLASFLYRRDIDEVIDAIRACWASAYTPHALAYRARHGVFDVPRVAVIVQQMVTGDVSGVAFAADPTTGRRDHVRITAAWGLADGVVSGRCNADELVVTHDGAVSDVAVATKDVMIVRSTEGVGTDVEAVPRERQDVVCLSDAQIDEVVRATVALSEAFGAPQDVEWTFVDDHLHVLQSRPITALPEDVEQVEHGPRIVFDNSNIQESYCGVTTPLTFSFAQAAYASVYEQTMRAVGIGDDVIEGHRDMLRNMLGLVRGRVYYNINNWYRGLLLLPSFGRNKEDMEAMMGLDVSVDFVEDEELGVGEKLRRLPGMLLTLVRLLGKFRRLDRDVPRFIADFEAAYGRIDRSRFDDATFSELGELVQQMRREMLENWSTPIINDFYVMMTVGQLRRLVESSGVEEPAEVVTHMMSGEEGIESLEPTRQLMRIARHAMLNPDLHRLLKHGGPLDALAAIRQERPDFAEQIDDYIERYGDRVIGELKLETITAREDPSFVIQVLRNFAHRPDLDPDALAEQEQQLRHDAEARVLARIGPVGRWRLRRALRAARTAVKYRENMRLARTRMFGLFRDAYRALGARLVEAGRLQTARDVFYLTTDELLAYQEGRAVSADLAGLVRARKAEYERYEEQQLPHHFETRGPVYHGNRYEGPESQTQFDPDAEVLHGTGCYPGVVEAPLRVIMSPSDNLDLDGRILTTLRTDPGWAPLFPASAGILVERGSTLSHSAVVARELGIPAVVGVPGLLATVADGEVVVLDGGAGTVVRTEAASR